MVGASGSGKSTFAKNLVKEEPNTVYLSSDGLRAVIGKDEDDQSVSGQVFVHLRHSVEWLLKSGHTVVVDALNRNKKSRADFVKIARKLNKEIIAYTFNVPLEVAKQRNSQRDRKVPDSVIENQFKTLEWPTLDEVDVIVEVGAK